MEKPPNKTKPKPEPQNPGIQKLLDDDPKTVVVVQAGIAIYLTVWLLLWAMFIFDVATLRFGVLKWLFRLEEVPYSEPLLLILLALAGGGIGGVIYGMEKLWKYATSKKHKFSTIYAGDYLLRQFGSAALGAIVFALMLSGLFNLDQLPSIQSDTSNQTPASSPAPAEAPEVDSNTESSSPEEENLTEASESTEETTPEVESPLTQKSSYFAFGVGFLGGFGSYQVTRKLDEIVKIIFGRMKPEDLEN